MEWYERAVIIGMWRCGASLDDIIHAVGLWSQSEIILVIQSYKHEIKENDWPWKVTSDRD